MNTQRSLSSLVSARICHDLVSPLGAIGNGLELIQLSGQGQTPELSLISESIENAAARLRFFRVAFGVAGDSQTLDGAECRRIAHSYFTQGRLSVDWQPAGTLARDEVRLAMLLLLCADSALPRGGRVSVTHHVDAWKITAEGPLIMTDPVHWCLLAGDARGLGDLGAGKVQFALAADAAEDLGRRIVADTGGDRLIVSF